MLQHHLRCWLLQKEVVLVFDHRVNIVDHQWSPELECCEESSCVRSVKKKNVRLIVLTFVKREHHLR